jgi:hypothetical protein
MKKFLSLHNLQFYISTLKSALTCICLGAVFSMSVRDTDWGIDCFVVPVRTCISSTLEGILTRDDMWKTSCTLKSITHYANYFILVAARGL